MGIIVGGDKVKTDAQFIMSDDDFVAIVNGDEDPQQLFMEVGFCDNFQGRMRVKGDMATATRFTPEVLPPLPRF